MLPRVIEAIDDEVRGLDERQSVLSCNTQATDLSERLLSPSSSGWRTHEALPLLGFGVVFRAVCVDRRGNVLVLRDGHVTRGVPRFAVPRVLVHCNHTQSVGKDPEITDKGATDITSNCGIACVD